MLLTDPRPSRTGPGRHRRPVSASQTLQVASGGIRAGLAKLVENDVLLILGLALLILGFVFMCLSAFVWFVRADSGLTFIFSAGGVALWVSACFVFAVFPPTSRPAHLRKDS